MTWESRLKEKFSRIPGGLDILLSHGPAYGLCDKILMPAWAGCSDGNLGSTELRAAVERAKPAWLFCGHIHSGEHSAVECGPTKAVNVSLVDEEYFKAYGVFTAELEGKEQC
jgi:Icc-related predicted phosphoesterase